MGKIYARSNSTNLIDPDTGELLTGVLTFRENRKVSPFSKEGFVMISQKNLCEATRNLTKGGLKVFIYLAGNVKFDGEIHLSPTGVAHELQMNVGQTSGAIRQLIKEGIISPTDKRLIYKVSPRLMWKGSIRAHARALNDE